MIDIISVLMLWDALKNNSQKYLPSLVVIIAFLTRLPYLTSNMDMWDVVFYKNSLEKLQFLREGAWPVLLVIQKLLWELMPQLSAQQILSLTNILLASVTLGLFFSTVYNMTKSYLMSSMLTIVLYLTPLFSVYSVVGLQDMSFAFVVMMFAFFGAKYINTEKIQWVIGASITAGLGMGFKFTLLLLLPALLYLTLRINKKNINVALSVIASYVISVTIVIISGLFVPRMENADPIGFFINEFRGFNPVAVGIFSKAGKYQLFSGYSHVWFYVFPFFWLGLYAYMKVHKGTKDKHAAKITTLLLGFASAFVSYGTSIENKISALPIIAGCLMAVSLLFLAIEIYSIISNRKKASMRVIDKMTVFFMLIAAAFILFNYSSTAWMARYLLPVLPITLLLVCTLSWFTEKSITISACGISLLLLVAAPPTGVYEEMGRLHRTDTRTSVINFIKENSGIYFNNDQLTLSSYIDSAGLGSSVEGPLFVSSCQYYLNGLSTTENKIYIIVNNLQFINESDFRSCNGYSFEFKHKFVRNQNLIEEQADNLGFSIYQITKI